MLINDLELSEDEDETSIIIKAAREDELGTRAEAMTIALHCDSPKDTEQTKVETLDKSTI